MKITIWIYLILLPIGFFRILYEILDCMISYKYEAADTYGYLNSKFLWLFVFAFYTLISITIGIAVLIKIRNKKSSNIPVKGY